MQKSILVFTIFLFSILSVTAQKTTKEFQLSAYNKINVGGSGFEILIKQSPAMNLSFKASEDELRLIIAEVKDSTLFISNSGATKSSDIKVFVDIPALDVLYAHGSSRVNCTNPVKGENLTINASGATEVDMNIEVTNLTTKIGGAAIVKLRGIAENHQLNTKNSGKLKAYDLITQTTTANLKGNGTSQVHAVKLLDGEISGAADLVYKEEPESRNIYKNTIVASYDESMRADTSTAKVGGIDIEVVEKDEITEVKVGNRKLIVDEDGHVQLKRMYKHKYNGHWAGLDFGWNGYVNSDYNMSFPTEYEYLNLRVEKSFAVNLNFFEQNVALAKNQKWGFTSGLGFTFANYRFQKSYGTHLSQDSAYLVGYKAEGITVKNSKLVTWHLTVPVLFEFQTNRWHKKNSFHASLGMIAGIRLHSWTYKKYESQNKDFVLTKYDLNTGIYEPAYNATSPGVKRVRTGGDWYLQPFKFDISARIGWGWINLWATFTVNTMFRQDRGPELYPWSAGITLINF